MRVKFLALPHTKPPIIIMPYTTYLFVSVLNFFFIKIFNFVNIVMCVWELG